jgi:hypothetical protein
MTKPNFLPTVFNFTNSLGEKVEVTFEGFDPAALAHHAARNYVGKAKRPGGIRRKMLGGSVVLKVETKS